MGGGSTATHVYVDQQFYTAAVTASNSTGSVSVIVPLPVAGEHPDTREMTFIPAGFFQMGCSASNSSEVCSDEYWNSEVPVHSVNLSAYWIDKYEVTNGQYQECVRAGACTPPFRLDSNTRSTYYEASNFADYPVIYVSWPQAVAFCAWSGKRLPTEAEWEKAARGYGFGNTRKFPWGNSDADCSKLNLVGCVGDTIHVGCYPLGASPYGVMDVAGNVEEWVSDWYASYNGNSETDPQGPATGDRRVVRDVSWNDGGQNGSMVRYVHLTSRYGGLPVSYTPDWNEKWLGFRCARSGGE